MCGLVKHKCMVLMSCNLITTKLATMYDNKIINLVCI